MTQISDFISELRLLTGYSESILSTQEAQTVMRRAEKHIRSEKTSLADDYSFLDNTNGEEALLWYSCLFSKLSTGEIGSQDFSAGSLDQQALLAADDGSVTTWYRNARKALDSIEPGQNYAISAPARPDRRYTAGDFETRGDSSNEVTDTDI